MKDPQGISRSARHSSSQAGSAGTPQAPCWKVNPKGRIDPEEFENTAGPGERCLIPFAFACSRPEMSREGLMRGRLGRGGQGGGVGLTLLSPRLPGPTEEQPCEPDHLVKYYFSPN